MYQSASDQAGESRVTDTTRGRTLRLWQNVLAANWRYGLRCGLRASLELCLGRAQWLDIIGEGEGHVVLAIDGQCRIEEHHISGVLAWSGLDALPRQENKQVSARIGSRIWTNHQGIGADLTAHYHIFRGGYSAFVA